MPTPALVDGDANFRGGLDSFSESLTLPPGKYAWSENMVMRGGVPQTRPGIRTRFKLPDGNFQGFTTYIPSRGLSQLIAFVSGIPYASDFPYRSFRRVGGVQLDSAPKRIYTTNTSKAVSRNPDGSLRLITPQSLLIAQDSVSPAAFYDGSTFQFSTGQYAIPQGSIMCWAGSRLWVARREKLFAGDIADPLSFAEQTFNTLGGINFYILPGPITGLTETPGVNLPLLLAYTDSTTTTFRSDVRDRTQWNSIQDFQRKIFPMVGCVSQRSISSLGGTLYWFSTTGQTCLDTAQFNSQSTKLNFLDNEMMRSKARLSDDLSGIASASFDNFLLTSVPHADKFNRHTWVIDEANIATMSGDSDATWASVWTGFRPVEYASVKIDGLTRLFCGSADADGHNRVYEMFTSDRRDNGCDIPWALETRAYTAGTMDQKHFRYAEFLLSELLGQVDVAVSWAGALRGRWKRCSTPTFQSLEGNIHASKILDHNTPLYGFKKQSRLARTQDIRELREDELTSSGIEGPVVNVEPTGTKEAIDTAFQFRIEGSGQCAIREFKVFMDPQPPSESGQKETIETEAPAVRFDGAASKEPDDLDEPSQVFSGTKTEVARYKNYASTNTVTVLSLVSQSDADKRASQQAREAAEAVVLGTAPKHLGGKKLA